MAPESLLGILASRINPQAHEYRFSFHLRVFQGLSNPREHVCTNFYSSQSKDIPKQVARVERIPKMEYIRCKPTSPCKPCKLQSGPPDQHSRESPEGVGGVICKSVITQSKSGWLIVKLLSPLMPLGC